MPDLGGWGWNLDQANFKKKKPDWFYSTQRLTASPCISDKSRAHNGQTGFHTERNITLQGQLCSSKQGGRVQPSPQMASPPPVPRGPWIVIKESQQSANKSAPAVTI